MCYSFGGFDSMASVVDVEGFRFRFWVSGSGFLWVSDDFV